MQYCFGPVPSRRLGLSLGVDILPVKTCNLNCIYCELGASKKFVTSRGEYTPVKEIMGELEDLFSGQPPVFDVLTITASGEPTLNSGLGRLIDFVKRLTDKPVALLTNSTLLGDPEVRRDILNVDIILPSLDSALTESFRKVNRPAPNVDLQSIIDGLCALRGEFSREIWLEILFVQDVNDSDRDIAALKDAVNRIRPDRIQINTVARPPAESWAKPISQEKMEELRCFFGEKAQVAVDLKGNGKVRGRLDTSEKIFDMLHRRPMSFDDLTSRLGMEPEIVNKTLDKLLREGKIVKKIFRGQPFYVASTGS